MSMCAFAIMVLEYVIPDYTLIELGATGYGCTHGGFPKIPRHCNAAIKLFMSGPRGHDVSKERLHEIEREIWNSPCGLWPAGHGGNWASSGNARVA